MTYEEKVKSEAIRIVSKFEPYCYHERMYCALIVVDEIIQAKQIRDKRTMEYKYWQEVKKEIQKL